MAAPRPDRLVNRLKSINLDDANAPRLTVLRQPRGPDNSKVCVRKVGWLADQLQSVLTHHRVLLPELFGICSCASEIWLVAVGDEVIVVLSQGAVPCASNVCIQHGNSQLLPVS